MGKDAFMRSNCDPWFQSSQSSIPRVPELNSARMRDHAAEVQANANLAAREAEIHSGHMQILD
eukprot:gene4474-14848_t